MELVFEKEWGMPSAPFAIVEQAFKLKFIIADVPLANKSLFIARFLQQHRITVSPLRISHLVFATESPENV